MNSKPQPQNLVGSPLFLGRIEEQKQFRSALTELLYDSESIGSPHIFLIFGDGGLGKTALAQQFYKLAMVERPFKGNFQSLWIDWEYERRRGVSGLQVGREHINAETVFQVIHQSALDQDLGKYFSDYKNAEKQKQIAETVVNEAMASSSDEDEFAQLRTLGAGAIAKVVRLFVPVVGNVGEELTKTLLDHGIKVSAKQAHNLRSKLEKQLRRELNPEQFKVFLNPDEQLAFAMAAGLKKITEDKPLVIFLDTYEIIDRADNRLRTLIYHSGPRVMWVIGGRNNLLHSRKFGEIYFRGYEEDFTQNLRAFDLSHSTFTSTYIQKYFDLVAPDRPLNSEELQMIYQATHGIPLAVREAAEIWKKGNPTTDILGEIDPQTTSVQVVQQMTARYLQHVVSDEDKHLIYALALARSNITTLIAMLSPQFDGGLNLDTLLHRLERKYASVHAERARLHDEPAHYLRNYLKGNVRRYSDTVKTYNQRAIESLRKRLQQLEEHLPLVEERYLDDDWVTITLDLTHHLFWLDDYKGWHWFIPRFVESLTYNQEFCRGLTDIVDEWKKYLSKSIQRQFSVLRLAVAEQDTISQEKKWVSELSTLAKRGLFEGKNEVERMAILDFFFGRMLARQGEKEEALERFENAEKNLPEDSIIARRQLARWLNYLAHQFMWPDDRRFSRYSPEAERIMPKVVEWLPDNFRAWYNLGSILAISPSAKREEAIAAFQKVIELKPTHSYAHHRLGGLLSASGQTEEAITYYLRAIELDSQNATAYWRLSQAYTELGQLNEASIACEKATGIDPMFAPAYRTLGYINRILGRHEEAMKAYQTVLDLDSEQIAAYVGLGDIYRDQGHYTDAIEYYKKRLQLSQAQEYDTIAYVRLGEVYQLVDRLAEAQEAYNKGLESATRFRRAVLRLSIGLMRIHQFLGEAEELNGLASTISEAVEGSDEYLRACYASVRGDADEAIRLLRIAIENKQESVAWVLRDPCLSFVRNQQQFQELGFHPD